MVTSAIPIDKALIFPTNMNVPEIIFIPHLYSSFPKHGQSFSVLQPQRRLQELEWFAWKLFAHSLDFRLKPSCKKYICNFQQKQKHRKGTTLLRHKSSLWHHATFMIYVFLTSFTNKKDWLKCKEIFIIRSQGVRRSTCKTLRYPGPKLWRVLKANIGTWI